MSDTALESADIILLSNDITRIPYSIVLGRKTLRIIKQNLWIAVYWTDIKFSLTFSHNFDILQSVKKQ